MSDKDKVYEEIKELEEKKREIDEQIKGKLNSLKNSGDFCKKLETEFNEYGINSDLSFNKVGSSSGDLKKA